MAIGTAYVQGEDVAARGRVLLFSIGRNADNPQNLVLLGSYVLCFFSFILSFYFVLQLSAIYSNKADIFVILDLSFIIANAKFLHY